MPLVVIESIDNLHPKGAQQGPQDEWTNAQSAIYTLGLEMPKIVFKAMRDAKAPIKSKGIVVVKWRAQAEAFQASDLEIRLRPIWTSERQKAEGAIRELMLHDVGAYIELFARHGDFPELVPDVDVDIDWQIGCGGNIKRDGTRGNMW